MFKRSVRGWILDTQIIIKAQKGDAEAFYQLMNLHKNKLYRIAFRYLKNENGALEAIQETTFRAYRNLKKLKQLEYFQTWLIRILINVCQDELKYMKRQASFDFEVSADLSSIDNNPSEPGGKADLERLDILVALESMEFKYRQIIELKYFEDLTLRDIAVILERPEGTVKTWLNQALKQLREHLRERGDSHA